VKKGLLMAVVIALVLVTLGVAGCTGFFGSEETEVASTINSQQDIGIWVTGVGEVTVVPDIAVLSLGVQAQKDTVAEAQREAAEAMDAVMNVLDSYGVDEKDIQTQYFSIQPVYDWDDGKQTLVGYRVTNTVAVKIRNIDDAGEIIDAVVIAGGDYTIVNSISFTVDEPEAYYEDAREEAMADAKAKAQQLADLGGVKLGKPTYINEYSGYTSSVVYRDYEVAEGTSVPETPISPGEMEIQLTVQVVYSISK
jgi:uncharacterized protein YggE